MSKSKFPLTISAVQKRDKCQWEIGDALLAECGPPSESGVNDGSEEKIDAVAGEIAGLKIDEYTPRYLRLLRQVAHNFHGRNRRILLSWSAHRYAGTPEMLDAIVQTAPKGEKVSRDYVREMRDQIEQKTPVQIEDDDTKRAPLRKPTYEQAQQAATQVSINRALHQLTAMIAGAESTVDHATQLFADNSEHFVPEAFDALIEQALTVANKWREFSVKVGKCQPKKRGHLAAVS